MLTALKIKKCKFCYTKLDTSALVCDVCNIECAKDEKDLTKEEKKIWHCCRNLRGIGFIHGAIAIGSLFILIFVVITLVPANLATNKNLDAILPMLPLFGLTFILSGCALFFAISLRKYQKWCYIAGIIFYSLTIIIGLLVVISSWHNPEPPRLGILFILSFIFLPLIAGPTAKKIFYRQVKNSTSPPLPRPN